MDQSSHKWNVLARIRRPLKLVTERIDGTTRGFAPRNDLSWPSLGPWRIYELRIFVWYAGRAREGVSPGFDFAGDFGPPMGAVPGDLKGDPCAFDASDQPTLRKQRSDDARKSPSMTADREVQRTRASALNEHVQGFALSNHHISAL
jgi:hypothetical protein